MNTKSGRIGIYETCYTRRIKSFVQQTSWEIQQQTFWQYIPTHSGNTNSAHAMKRNDQCPSTYSQATKVRSDRYHKILSAYLFLRARGELISNFRPPDLPFPVSSGSSWNRVRWLHGRFRDAFSRGSREEHEHAESVSRIISPRVSRGGARRGARWFISGTIGNLAQMNSIQYNLRRRGSTAPFGARLVIPRQPFWSIHRCEMD